MEGFVGICCWPYRALSVFFSKAFSEQLLRGGVMYLRGVGLYDTEPGQVSLRLFTSETMVEYREEE